MSAERVENARPRRTSGAGKAVNGDYRLEDQVGFAIRKASQRHTLIFSKMMIGDLTSTQWAALVKAAELGPVSQNQLGRETAMDVATIKGVVDRLVKRGLVATADDPGDGRRSVITLTPGGALLVVRAKPIASAITAETLSGLSAVEQRTLIDLLRKIA